MTHKYNKKNPPRYGQLSIEEWEELVDEKSFPICGWCNQRIYNPEFYNREACGPCLTGEARTLMK